MLKLNSDYTAVYRDKNGIHILKAKIIDDNFLYFQMFNKTKNILLPVFKIRANYGVLPFLKPNESQKKFEADLCLTKNINRNRLILYFKQFELSYLIGYYQNK